MRWWPLSRILPDMNYPPILGLVGPLGCGKTTTADAIAKMVHGRRLSCAGPIRDMLVALGVSREDLTKNKNKPQAWLHDRSGRQLMQSLGTEWGRVVVGPDIWINAVIREAGGGEAPIIVDDIRFDNEAAAVKVAGGQLLYVHSDIDYTYAHLSECGLSDWSVLDGVLDLETPNVWRNTGSTRPWFHPRNRPWWSYFKLGRKLFSSRPVRPDVGSLAAPDMVASLAVAYWSEVRGFPKSHEN